MRGRFRNRRGCVVTRLFAANLLMTHRCLRLARDSRPAVTISLGDHRLDGTQRPLGAPPPALIFDSRSMLLTGSLSLLPANAIAKPAQNGRLAAPQ